MSLESCLLNSHPLSSASCREGSIVPEAKSDIEQRKMPSLISGDSTQSRQGYGDLSCLKRETQGGAGRQQVCVGGAELFPRAQSPCLSSAFLVSGLKPQERTGCSLLTHEWHEGSPRVLGVSSVPCCGM